MYGIFNEVVFLNENTNKEFYFYHLAPKRIEGNALLSPYAMERMQYDELLTDSIDKYRDRMVDGWGIYPNKKANELSNKEILNGINRYRGTNGSKMIYFFKYPPYKKLGKNMKKILESKDIYRIDLNDTEIKRQIEEIDWGFENSHKGNRKLNRSYYENISFDDYFSNYDDNNYPIFASLNHISIAFKDGMIGLKYLKRINEGEL